MKKDIHPEYNEISVTCVCGSEFKTRSTCKEALKVDVCSACHPFFTGKQKIVDTAGRIDRFKKKFGGRTAKAPTKQEQKAKAGKTAASYKIPLPAKGKMSSLQEKLKAAKDKASQALKS